MPSTRQSRDVHAELTNKIIAQMDADNGSFQMPWHNATGALHMPRNIASGNDYRGVNVVALWIASNVNGYASNVWGTYKQWRGKDCQVRKGEKASMVVFFKEWHVKPDPDDPLDDGKRLVAKASSVFNAQQVDGHSDDVIETPDHGPIDRLKLADYFIASTGADIRHGGPDAYYHRAQDRIQLPDESRFFDTATSTRTQAYYSTALHELTHWTGAKKRLDRIKGKRFGDPSYAFEELVAELGAAFACAKLGIENEPRLDHARYLQNWLKCLRDDKKAIFNAASHAAKAVDYLADLQPKLDEQEAA